LPPAVRFYGQNAPNSISARGAYSAPSDPLAGFRGPTSKGEGKGGRGKEGGEREGRERGIRDGRGDGGSV